MSLVSVIIPNYNNEVLLLRCIESCIKQGEYLKEIIVVDDHSTDGSWKLLTSLVAKYSNYLKLFKNPSKGANSSRNFGFRQSTGEYIQWLDADDYLLPNKFEVQINALQNSEGKVAYSDWRFDTYDFSNLSNLVSIEIKKSSKYADYLLELIKDNWLPPHAYLVERTLCEKLEKMGGWNESLVCAQDRSYFTLLATLTNRFVYVSGVYIVYNRWSSESISQRFSLKIRWKNIYQILKQIENILLSQNRKNLDVYKRYINAQKLMAKVFCQSIVLTTKPRIDEVAWSYIRGYRTRLKCFLLWNKINGQNE